MDENTLYRLRSKSEQIGLGSELIEGIVMSPGDWRIEAIGPAPYARPR